MPVRAWDPTPYPDARKREVFGGTAAAVPELTLPRSRVWSFSLWSTLDNQVRTAVSFPFVGPGLVKQLRFEGQTQFSADTTRQTEFAMRWAEDDSGHGVNGVAVAFPAGNPLWESTTSRVSFAPTVDADAIGRLPSAIAWRHDGAILVDRYITAPRFWLKASIRCRQAADNTFDGIVTVYEAVPPELALDLMG